MHTILLVTLLVIVIAPAAVAVISVQVRADHLPRIPFGFDRETSVSDARERIGWASNRLSSRRFGPDTDRIHDALVMLNLHRRDSA